MVTLDQIDSEILQLLSENARLSYTDIADEVGLSGPAVADRIDRLQEAEIINRFTVDIDRTQLSGGAQIFVQVDPGETFEQLRKRLERSPAVEHLITTAEGELWFNARTDVNNVHSWLRDLLEPTGDVEYSVTLVDEIEWQPTLDSADLTPDCAECGNTVDSEGEGVWIDETIYHFCCPTCQDRFEDRFEQFNEGL